MPNRRCAIHTGSTLIGKLKGESGVISIFREDTKVNFIATTASSIELTKNKLYAIINLTAIIFTLTFPRLNLGNVLPPFL